MTGVARQVYVISDLHLGGVYPDPTKLRDPGFRICTEVPGLTAFVDALARKPARDPRIELVINGDLVDFLAEREARPPHWAAFTHDPDVAARKLESIAERDHALFSALARFLERGHRLVLLLGNHDIELALPPVRRALTSLIGADGGRDFEFLHDGEAYLVGDALIEHGNRYDRFNMVDFNGLRRFRSLLSRKQTVLPKHAFNPPAGSKMVAGIINPIKEDYPFIDLLKPETDAVIPLLLALEPSCRSLLGRAAKYALESMWNRFESAALPASAGDIAAEHANGAAARAGITRVGPDAALRQVVESVMGEEGGEFLEGIAEADAGGNIAASATPDGALDRLDRTLGLMRLVFTKAKDHIERRCPLLLRACRALHKDRSFHLDVETAPEYLNAARDLAGSGIRHVIFGHTHLAKKIPLDGGGFYLNAGTWSNVMEFPTEILSGERHDALRKIHEFVKRLADGDFTDWTLSRPTYVRLDLGADGRVANAELCRYADPASL